MGVVEAVSVAVLPVVTMGAIFWSSAGGKRSQGAEGSFDPSGSAVGPAWDCEGAGVVFDEPEGVVESGSELSPPQAIAAMQAVASARFPRSFKCTANLPAFSSSGS